MPQSSFGVCLDEAALAALARELAQYVTSGDCIALRGDLGAGKTTFARALIRALLDDPKHDVPSPTFALRQDYESARGSIVHFDLYRIQDARDLEELGFDEALATAITIVEWPERAENILPADRLELVLSEAKQSTSRNIKVAGLGRSRAIIGKLATRL